MTSEVVRPAPRCTMQIEASGEFTWTEDTDTVIAKFPLSFSFVPGETAPLIRSAKVYGVSMKGEDVQAIPERTRLYAASLTGERDPAIHEFSINEKVRSQEVIVEAHFFR